MFWFEKLQPIISCHDLKGIDCFVNYKKYYLHLKLIFFCHFLYRGSPLIIPMSLRHGRDWGARIHRLGEVHRALGAGGQGRGHHLHNSVLHLAQGGRRRRRWRKLSYPKYVWRHPQYALRQQKFKLAPFEIRVTSSKVIEIKNLTQSFCE